MKEITVKPGEAGVVYSAEEIAQAQLAKVDRLLEEWDGTREHAETVLKKIRMWRQGNKMPPIEVEIPED